MIKQLKDNWMLIAIISVFVIIKVFLLFTYNSLFFDEYGYIGIGKFLLSGGETGFFDEMRPLVVPLILGLGWFAGFDITVFGWIISMLFSAGVIVMSYLLAKKFFSRSAGVWAAFLLACYPLFFGNAHRILTHMPAVFFAMLAIYLFSEKFYGCCGFVAALAFMTRFPHGILIIPLALFILFSSGNWKNIFKFLAGYIIPFGCFLTFNIFFYHDVTANIFDAMRRPFIIANEGVMSYNLNLYTQPFYYYFVQLFIENWLIVLLAAFAFFYFKNKLYDSHSCDLFVTVTIFYVVYFSWIAHKEYRYALDFLPFIIIMVAYALEEILFWIRKKWKWLFFILVAAIFIAVILGSVQGVGMGYLGVRDNAHTALCEFFSSYKEDYRLFSTTSVVVPCTDSPFFGRYYDFPGGVDFFLDSSYYNMFLFSNASFPCTDKKCEDEKGAAFKKLSDGSKMIFETRSKYEYFAVFKKQQENNINPSSLS